MLKTSGKKKNKINRSCKKRKFFTAPVFYPEKMTEYRKFVYKLFGIFYNSDWKEEDILKINVFVDKTKEEKIDIYIHERRQIVDDIEKLISEENELLCYKNGEIYKMNFSEIVLFSVENEKVAVFTEKDKFFVKERLYIVEEKMPSFFIRLNCFCAVRFV